MRVGPTGRVPSPTPALDSCGGRNDPPKADRLPSGGGGDSGSGGGRLFSHPEADVFDWGLGFRFGLLGGGGWRWKTPGGRCPCYTAQSVSAAPMRSSGDSGVPGRGDATGPLPLCARRATDWSGPDVRVGSYGVGCTALRRLRAPGPAVGAVQA